VNNKPKPNQIKLMSIITEYQIVHRTKPADATEDVQLLIQQGFQPYGFPYAGHNGTTVQAMVKYGPPDSPASK
jgi:hypothetical protein